MARDVSFFDSLGRLLARKDRARFPARLGNGDQVAVFPRRSEVKEPARALVSRATATRVQLAFDREPPPFVHEGLLRLDRVPNDVTYERVRALASLESGILSNEK